MSLSLDDIANLRVERSLEEYRSYDKRFDTFEEFENYRDVAADNDLDKLK